ncbi:MAG: hypothetical protein MK180_15910 [Rhodobacteraceae bacterium]|nr:hypothetical protein [Paracoccaceae bacterium]
MDVFTLKNGRVRVDRIPGQQVRAFSKFIGPELGLPFVPMEVYYCDRVPNIKKLPTSINFAPRVFFTGITPSGFNDVGRKRRNRAGVLSVYGFNSTRQLSELIAGKTGKAALNVPVKEFGGLTPSVFRLVFGLYIYHTYFKMTVLGGPTKGASFILGIPYGVEWGMWQVGACGTYVTERVIEGEDGPVKVPVNPPAFVGGKYTKNKKAKYTALRSIGVGPKPTMGYPDPPLDERFSPTKEWKVLRNLPKKLPSKTLLALSEMTIEESLDAGQMQLTWDREKDGAAMLAKYG